MKRYVGTQGRYHYQVEWNLTEDGTFSAGFSEINKVTGESESYSHDFDTLAKTFPNSDFVLDFCFIAKVFNNNDLQAGSPKQEKFLKDVVAQEYEALKVEHKIKWEAYTENKKVAEKNLLKRLRKIARLPGDDPRAMKKVIAWFKTNAALGKATAVIPTVVIGHPYTSHMTTISLSKNLVKNLIAKCPELGIYYDYKITRLKDEGLYRDATYKIDGIAYAYGSKWLKLDISEQVRNTINSWEEVRVPTTKLEEACVQINFSYKTLPSDKDGRHNYDCVLNGEHFEYHKGSALKEPPTVIEIYPAILDDAYIGSDGFECALDYCLDELGYEDAREAIKVAKACVDAYEKCIRAGIWNETLLGER